LEGPRADRATRFPSPPADLQETNMSVDFAAIDQILEPAARDGRRALFEHEVYALVRASGAVRVPHTVFRPAGETFVAGDLEGFAGDRMVLKVVSPDLAHKSDVGGVRFVPCDLDEVRATADDFARIVSERSARLSGVLMCEFMPHDGASLGNELFVGVRASREFGPIIAAGLGGVHTEYLASVAQKGKAIATALVEQTDGRRFFELFSRTMAYDILSGRARGYRRIIADETLIECFDAFIAIAHRYCDNARGDQPIVAELEVNPFSLFDGHMVPLDGLCHLSGARELPPPRPIQRIAQLLHPQSIAIVGVSSKSMNMGRVIVNNVLACGFDRDQLTIIKPGADELDGVRCVDSLAALPEPVDLLVVCVAADQVPTLADEVLDTGAARSVILIPGGMGETAGGREAEARLRKRIVEQRAARADGGPIFLGGNCLGVQSRPGAYDTMFIPAKKLAKRWDFPGRRTALISQSGAYVITRMSNLETLDPDYAISIGNQIDLTISDLVAFVDEHTDIEVIGVYVEGFRNLDGLELARIVRRAVSRGKDVIFYKAGRTPAGQSATAGHTASIAGDYNVCEAALVAAGALVVQTFKDFERLLHLAAHLHNRIITGTAIAAVSNAGYEVVGMADATRGPYHELTFGKLRAEDEADLRTMLQRYNLDRLVNVANPLDLTPMAPDAAHEEAIRLLLECPNVDAVIASFVPLTPTMKTTPDEIDDASSMAQRLPRIFAETSKPLIVAIDSGPLYDPLARAIRDGGVPVFRSADAAVAALGRYVCHRVAGRR
jgi:acyl-CoA synthetase (NDP forming)